MYRGEKEMTEPVFPIFIINWIFGLGIIEYPMGNQRPIISFLYSSIILVTYCSFTVYSYPFAMRMVEDLEMNRRIIRLLFFSHLLLTISSVVLAWHRSEGLHRVARQSIVADKLLEKMRIPRKYGKMFRVQLGKSLVSVGFAVSLVTLCSLDVFLKENVKFGEITAITTFNYPIVLMFIVDSTFVSIVECVNRKFRKLNKVLRDMLTSTKECPQHTKIIKRYLNEHKPSKFVNDAVTDDITDILRTAKKAHLELAIICQKADKTFGPHLLMSVVISIAVLTGSLYHIYVAYHFTNISAFDLFRLFLNNTTWIICYAVKLYILSNVCDTISQESIKTGDIISEFYDESFNSDEARAVIRHFHLQILKSSIKFTVGGFINLDLKLLQGITSSIVTYLMILGQFGNFLTPRNL